MFGNKITNYKIDGERMIVEVASVTEEHLVFIHKHGDNHITQDSYAYFRDKQFIGVILLEKRGESNELLGISFAGIQGSKCVHSIVVVDRRYRNNGFGSELLKRKKEICDNLNLTLLPNVSDKNLSSLAICRKIGIKANIIQRER